MNGAANINTNTPTRGKAISELKKQERIELKENALPLGEDGLPQKTYSSEFIEEYLWNKLDDHYGTDIRKL